MKKKRLAAGAAALVLACAMALPGFAAAPCRCGAPAGSCVCQPADHCAANDVCAAPKQSGQ